MNYIKTFRVLFVCINLIRKVLLNMLPANGPVFFVFLRHPMSVIVVIPSHYSVSASKYIPVIKIIKSPFKHNKS